MKSSVLTAKNLGRVEPRTRAAAAAERPRPKAAAPGRAFEDVVEQIRASITQGHLKPGDRLSTERDLAQELGVSRGTVREAVRSLENSGLVFLRRGPGGGVFVAQEDAGVIRKGVLDLLSLGVIEPSHLREARSIIGIAVARLAAVRRTYGDLEAMRLNIDKTIETMDTGNEPERIQLGFQFQRLLAQVTKNPALVILTDAILAMYEAFLEFGSIPDKQIGLRFKEKMFAAVENRDAETAAATMQAHLTVLENLYSAKGRRTS